MDGVAVCYGRQRMSVAVCYGRQRISVAVCYGRQRISVKNKCAKTDRKMYEFSLLPAIFRHFGCVYRLLLLLSFVTIRDRE
jgi:hypothetical protein